MTKVRSDQKGLYVQAGGYIARPGEVDGYSHAYRMDAGDLVAGDTVKARHMAQSQIVKVTTEAGTVLHWHTYGFWMESPPRDNQSVAPDQQSHPTARIIPLATPFFNREDS